MEGLAGDSALDNRESTAPEDSLAPSSPSRDNSALLGKKMPRCAVPDRHEDIEAKLKAFIEEFGTPGTLPTRAELREHRRFDLERFVFGAGAYEAVARQLGLKLSYGRKRRHYWDDFDNLKRAVSLVAHCFFHSV